MIEYGDSWKRSCVASNHTPQQPAGSSILKRKLTMDLATAIAGVDGVLLVCGTVWVADLLLCVAKRTTSMAMFNDRKHKMGMLCLAIVARHLF